MATANDVEIRVRVVNDTKAGLSRTTADARAAGGRAGDAFGDQFTRDANGRLHDQRGRYVAEGELAGRNYAKGFGKGFAGGGAAGGLKETLGKAVKDLGIAAAISTNPIGGLSGSVAALSGSLLLLPAAALAGGAALAALKIGTSGFGDALKNMDDPAKFAEALAKLSPEAKATALAVKELSPQFKDLKKSVQDGLFKGMATELKQVSSNLLPTLKKGLTEVSSGANAMGKGLADALKTSTAKNNLATVLGNTGKMLTNMRPVLGNVVSGFLSLGAAGSKFLPQFGTWLSNITSRFKTWAEEANRTGKAQEWIQRALDELKQVGGILKDLGSIGKSLAEAFGDASVLETIHGITSGVAEWLAKNKELLPILLNLFAAWKAFSAVKGIIGGVTGALDLLGASAQKAGDKVGTKGKSGSLVGNLGLIKGVAAAAGVAYVADQLDKANVAAAGGADKLTGVNDQLHDFVEMGKQIGSGDFAGIFKDIGDEWDELVRKFQTGESPIGKVITGMQGPLKDALARALDDVKAFSAGAQLALDMKAGNYKITADVGPATDGINHLVTFANGQTGTMTFGANGQPAQLTIDGVVYNVNTATGTLTVAANPNNALTTLDGTKITIDKTTGQVTITANPGPAQDSIDAITQRRYTAYVDVVTRAISPITGATGGNRSGKTVLVGEHGPELVRAMATGGASGGKGMRLVGERGPELISLGAGSSVLPYSNTQQTLQRAAQGGGSGGGGGVTVEFRGNTSDALATVIMRMIRTGKIQLRTAS